MTRNSLIYTTHALIVITTAFFSYHSGIASWYFALAIGLPLLISYFPKLSGLSYTINVRILFPISVGLLCVSFYHYFPQLMIEESQQQLERFGISNESSGIEQEFFQVNDVFKDAASVLYAICAAFLLWKGLSDFDELKYVLYEEANEVRSIGDYSTYFVTSGAPDVNEPTVRELRGLLLDYLDNMLRGNKVIASVENESVLERCLHAAGRLDAVDHNDKIALEEIMKSISCISVLRAKRTVCIEKRMSPFILVLMLLMSITMVSSFFGKANGEISIDYMYVFLLPAFYASIFMTLLDLSSPFDGYWSIKLEAIEGVQRKLSAPLHIASD